MYSKAQLLAAIKKELTVLEHLQSKISKELHNHKFTEPQRTIKDLLAYLATSPWKQVELILHGDMSIFADMKEYVENFKVEDFAKTLKHNAEAALAMIEKANDTILNETVSIFNGHATGTRAQLFVEMVYGQLLAYKMQLFLQMKHAGLGDLNSMNLWAGKDKPQA